MYNIFRDLVHDYEISYPIIDINIVDSKPLRFVDIHLVKFIKLFWSNSGIYNSLM